MTELPQEVMKRKDHGLVPLTELNEIVHQRGWMILPTDKNLGCAIVTREWYLEQCEMHLADSSSYKKITPDYTSMHITLLKEQISRLVRHNSLAAPRKEQIRDWLSKGIERGSPFDGLPHFYIIPKIHKNPWKAVALKNVSLPPPPPGFKYYIITGDVTAFYPNVDLAVAKDVVMFYMKGYPRIVTDESERDFIELLWQSANTSLIMRWQDRLYMQKKGLAMGCAHSPSVANLYGAYFEERIIPQLSRLQFYRRYIDDCLGIVLARSQDDAIEHLSLLRFPSCEIVWSADEVSQVFLDMTISLEDDGSSVTFKPYRKPLNSFERIPWASHHPQDVKRGTFLGEMSRLACLSSKRSFYDDALRELRDIYLGRGYPMGLVDSWLRNHAQERWDQRYEEKRVRDGVHVLKSVFNPVWDFVKTADLSEAIMFHWAPFMDSYERERKSRQERRVMGQSLITQHFLPKGVLGRRVVTGDSSPALLPPVTDRDLSTGQGTGRILQEYFDGGVPLRAHSAGFSSSGSEGQDDEGELDDDEQPEVPFDPPVEEVSSLVQLLDRRFVVAKKRNQTLGDVANTWRRSVLAYSSAEDAFPLRDHRLQMWMNAGKGYAS
ncbi:hypothetical protein FRC05_009080 [Tulasnella sp. 425]|nr:hypothetical protein FRC05_009080 [Tulasnella sp. 425]